MLDRILASVPFWRGGSRNRSEIKERVNLLPVVTEFVKVATAWRLTDPEARQLFGISRGIHRQLKRGRTATLARDQSARICLMGEIYKGLHVLYGSRRADLWVRSPNTSPLFEGSQPLQYMLQGGTGAAAKVRDFVGRWSPYSALK